MSDNPTHIKDLIPDPHNSRQHNPRNIGMIADAMQEVGAARSIVIDDENVVLCGNGAIEAAAQAGITNVRVIEADGNEIIAVRRRGLTREQKVRLALFDNRATDLSRFDPESVIAFHDEGLTDGIFTTDEVKDLLGDDMAFAPSESVEQSATKGLKQLQFTVTPEQAEAIRSALDTTIETGCCDTGPSPHKEGNALARLVEAGALALM